MEWNQDVVRVFRGKLAHLFPSERDARALLEDAKLDLSHIDVSGSAAGRWYEALSEARKHSGALDRLLNLAMERYPDDDFLKVLQRGALRTSNQPPVREWRGGRPTLEKIIGHESTLVPVSFLEQGLQCARAVARVVLPNGFGTGFLIREDLLLTNNHVLPSVAAAEQAIAEFNYQRASSGAVGPIHRVQLAPQVTFATSEERDWTVVAVEGRPGDTFGVLPLAATRVTEGEVVQVIQHPMGGEKQLSYRANVVAYVNADVVQYLTDTMPGSSGSPVFNRSWEVIALHHGGGWLSEAGNTSDEFFRNEGIWVNALLSELPVGLLR